MLSVKNLVKDKKVYFVKYRDNKLFYKTECGFEFDVPVSDIGEGCCQAEEKAIVFMRWFQQLTKNLFISIYYDTFLDN